ncbi:hypothetical protein D3C87_326200 [compost metagenome]
MQARHAGTVHTRVQNGALELAHFLDLVAQGVGQLLDHLGGEADAHQFVLDGFLGAHVDVRLVAVLLVRQAHLVELLADLVELGQGLHAQVFQLLAGHAAGGAVIAFVFVGGHAGAGVFFTVFRINEAVDDFVDLRLTFAHAQDVGQDFVDRGRAGRDGHDHVLQAIFDALGDLDFAFARQQLDRTHFTHVHAHGVGGAAEVGIHGGQRGLGFILDVVVVGRNRGVFAHQQRFGVGCLVVDRDTHVAEGADDAIDGFGVDQVIRQMIVDFAIRQVAAVLAQLDQLLQAVAAGFVFFGRHGAAGNQILGIGLAALAAALGRLQIGQDFAFTVHRIVETIGIVVGILGGAARAAAARHGTRAADQVGKLVFGLLGARLRHLFRLVSRGSRLRGLFGSRLGCGLGDLHRRLGGRFFRRHADGALGRQGLGIGRINCRGGFAGGFGHSRFRGRRNPFGHVAPHKTALDGSPTRHSIRVKLVNRRRSRGCVVRSASSCEPAWRRRGAIPSWRLACMTSFFDGFRTSGGLPAYK